MVYYNFINVVINPTSLIKIIINMVVWYHSLNLIVTNTGLIFTLKIWLFVCHFFNIKQ